MLLTCWMTGMICLSKAIWSKTTHAATGLRIPMLPGGTRQMNDRSESQPRSNPLRELRGDVLLVGAGKMGGALLEGWLTLGIAPGNLAVMEPQPSGEITALAARGVRLNPRRTSEGKIAALVLAVKPQVAPDVMPGLRSLVGSETAVVSIMAGRTLRFLESSLPGAAVVRAMPNTPAAIGRGITVAVPNPRVSTQQRELVHAILSAVGTVEWVDDEGLMDAVTALSGSGPAYVFLLAETMAQAGRAAGLPAPLAERLARATVAGSGELLRRSPLDPATLRQNVTSPGGTTAAALDVLMAANGLGELMTKAIAAATKRSQQLAG
jgi:pyrroline-5-carboxylate reductase